MNKFSFISLWDAYQGLLTRNQREITDMYFNLDLTVSEIASEKNVSRQAVSDCLKGCKQQLEEYEEKLHFCRKLREISLENSFAKTDALKWLEEFRALHTELREEANSLGTILNKDYSDEVLKALEGPELYKDYTQEV